MQSQVIKEMQVPPGMTSFKSPSGCINGTGHKGDITTQNISPNRGMSGGSWLPLCFIFLLPYSESLILKRGGLKQQQQQPPCCSSPSWLFLRICWAQLGGSCLCLFFTCHCTWAVVGRVCVCNLPEESSSMSGGTSTEALDGNLT